MKQPAVITSLEAELAGIELIIKDMVNALGDLLMTTREASIIGDEIKKSELLVKEYKSAIRVLNLFDEVSIDNF